MKQRLEQMKENGENITNAQEFEKLQIEIMKTESSLKKASNAKEMFENGFKTATIINAFSNVKNAIDSVINTVMKIGNGIYETANVYAELEAESAKFNSSFGDLSDTMTEKIVTLAETTGILEGRFYDAAASINSFAMAAGADTQTALDLTTGALTIAADTAAFYDISLEEATDKLQSFLKGHYAMDSSLGVSATEFTRNAKAVELFSMNFKELNEVQKQQTLLQMVADTNKLSGALGQAERESDTLGNQTANLQRAYKELQGELGESLSPAVIYVMKAIENLTNWTQNLIIAGKELIKENLDKFMPLFNTLKGTISAVCDIVSLLVKEFMEIVGYFSSKLMPSTVRIQGVFANLFNVIKTLSEGLKPVISLFGDLAIVLIDLVAPAINEVHKFITALYNAIISLMQGIAQMWSSFVKMQSQIGSSILKMFTGQQDLKVQKEMTKELESQRDILSSVGRATKIGADQQDVEQQKAMNKELESQTVATHKYNEVRAEGTKVQEKEISLLKEATDLLNHKKALGLLSAAEELEALENLSAKQKLTAQEQLTLEENIYSLKQTLLKEAETNVNEYAQAVTIALKNQKNEELDIIKDRLNEEIELIREAGYDEIEVSTTVGNTKLKLLDEEYIAKVRLVDDVLANTLEAGNREIQQRIDIIRLTDDETATRLQQIQDEINAIDEKSAAEKNAMEQAKEAGKKADLEKAVQLAEDTEAKKKAEDELSKYLTELTYKREEEERRVKRQSLEQQTKDILEETKKRIDEEIRLANELANEQAQALKDAEQERTKGKYSLASLEEIRKDFEKEAEKITLTLIGEGSEGQKKALDILKEYYPEYKDVGKTIVDKLKEGLMSEENVLLDYMRELSNAITAEFNSELNLGTSTPNSPPSASFNHPIIQTTEPSLDSRISLKGLVTGAILPTMQAGNASQNSGLQRTAQAKTDAFTVTITNNITVEKQEQLPWELDRLNRKNLTALKEELRRV